jgi:hypothetical protein
MPDAAIAGKGLSLIGWGVTIFEHRLLRAIVEAMGSDGPVFTHRGRLFF